ncbi:MAG TPA: hypothetical protein VGF55_25785 [Gemmataceae bacterium]
MRRRRLIWVVGVAAGAALVIWIGSEVVEYGQGIGREGRVVLREGTRVEVFRVDPDDPPRPPTGGPRIGHHYPILSQGKDLGADFAARLADVVIGQPPLEYKCGIQPGVAFRVWRGDQCVEVLVCFNCDVLAMHLGSGDWDWANWMLRHFRGDRAKLLALCKEALPDDPVIQGLPDVRPTEWSPGPAAAQGNTTGTTGGRGRTSTRNGPRRRAVIAG